MDIPLKCLAWPNLRKKHIKNNFAIIHENIIYRGIPYDRGSQLITTLFQP